VQVLRPEGQVLLLEHGRASWGWLNTLLDADARRHHERWGCWWNRDIIAIVKEAGLEVSAVTRWHFGTTYLIHAKVPGSDS
jgi:methyltransferase OMS1, mitochondrial